MLCNNYALWERQIDKEIYKQIFSQIDMQLDRKISIKNQIDKYPEIKIYRQIKKEHRNMK